MPRQKGYSFLAYRVTDGEGGLVVAFDIEDAGGAVSAGECVMELVQENQLPPFVKSLLYAPAAVQPSHRAENLRVAV